ncbi:hypothetical protein F183_A40400 [Bryobacterales bacterium F-183]|nr:hypothetical protein F183_A40400 [Bryobacterales bacterium F-183]
MLKTKLASVFCAICLIAAAQETLTNDSILKMVKAGLGESIILSMVAQSPGKYNTSIDDLIALKKAGVPEKVVAAMVSKGAGGAVAGTAAPAAAAEAPAKAAPTLEIGVYFKKNGEWTEVLPEVVNWKTGGTIKSLASAGVVKKDVNGNINGPTSRNTVKGPLEFLIVSTEGTSITEYQLIRLRLNKDYREFRTVTGGIMNQQSGAMRDLVPFEGKKLAPRQFEVVLPATLGAGEYGFLAPGAMGSSGNSAAQIGKMYTFRIIE